MAGIKPKRKRINKLNAVCPFCKEKKPISWRESAVLSGFLTPRGRLMARKQSGICARHQKAVARSVKQARHLSLLSFVGIVAEN